MKQLSHASVFLAQFLRHPLRVGSLVPSSSLLARSLIPDAILAEAQLIVELGPGTGVVTGELIRAKPNTCRYLGIELNRSFSGGGVQTTTTFGSPSSVALTS